MKFREHRGNYDDSMETVVELKDKFELIDHLHELLLYCEGGPHNFPSHHLKVERYVMDGRNGWDTHIVTVDGYGVMGYTDGPVEA